MRCRKMKYVIRGITQTLLITFLLAYFPIQSIRTVYGGEGPATEWSSEIVGETTISDEDIPMTDGPEESRLEEMGILLLVTVAGGCFCGYLMYTRDKKNQK